MKAPLLKSFINRWNSVFAKHPWVEAFILSIVFHIVFLNFIWLMCQVHVMIFKDSISPQIIEIEFIK